jgi:small subunit ribosomal protein S7
MRRRKSEVRLIKPDPQFSDKLVTRFINSLMKDGKKNVARKILYQAFEIIEEKTGKSGHRGVPDCNDQRRSCS